MNIKNVSPVSEFLKRILLHTHTHKHAHTQSPFQPVMLKLCSVVGYEVMARAQNKCSTLVGGGGES